MRIRVSKTIAALADCNRLVQSSTRYYYAIPLTWVSKNQSEFLAKRYTLTQKQKELRRRKGLANFRFIPTTPPFILTNASCPSSSSLQNELYDLRSMGFKARKVVDLRTESLELGNYGLMAVRGKCKITLSSHARQKVINRIQKVSKVRDSKTAITRLEKILRRVARAWGYTFNCKALRQIQDEAEAVALKVMARQSGMSQKRVAKRSARYRRFGERWAHVLMVSHKRNLFSLNLIHLHKIPWKKNRTQSEVRAVLRNDTGILPRQDASYYSFTTHNEQRKEWGLTKILPCPAPTPPTTTHLFRSECILYARKCGPVQDPTGQPYWLRPQVTDDKKSTDRDPALAAGTATSTHHGLAPAVGKAEGVVAYGMSIPLEVQGYQLSSADVCGVSLMNKPDLFNTVWTKLKAIVSRIKDERTGLEHPNKRAEKFCWHELSIAVPVQALCSISQELRDRTYRLLGLCLMRRSVGTCDCASPERDEDSRSCTVGLIPLSPMEGEPGDRKRRANAMILMARWGTSLLRVILHDRFWGENARYGMKRLCKVLSILQGLVVGEVKQVARPEGGRNCPDIIGWNEALARPGNSGLRHRGGEDFFSPTHFCYGLAPP